ncbi:MAG: GNAT family N-acetyltransferase [Rhodobacteraceae bacterium]|nr:GNAT family N-acetyltransferase [Paracoccaceae bacterium]
MADEYKSEIGFWARPSLSDAIKRKRLISAVLDTTEGPIAVGFLVHSGVHPSSKIQAVAVHPDHLRLGIAQSLLDAAVSQLEAEHFISVCAKPAKDLEHAQRFYEKNGFEIVRVEAGGQTRKRQIVVRERILGGPSLFDTFEQEGAVSTPAAIDNVRNRLWIIDVNVLFDLLKSDRERYKKAYSIIGAALAGRISIAVTSEFREELQRNSGKFKADPILELALALPTIFIAEKEALREKTTEAHDLIFAKSQSKQAGTPQALSDCRHIAECALGNAAAFITSDGPLLKSRSIIRKHFGLEVAALDDFYDALSFYDIKHDGSDINAEGFRIKVGTHNSALKLITKTKSQPYTSDVTFPSSRTNTAHIMLAYNDGGDVIGYLNVQTPARLGGSHKIILIVDHQDGIAEQVADALMGKGLEMLTKGGPHLASLADIPGQSTVRRVAQQLGFKLTDKGRALGKLVLGGTLTPNSIADQLNKLRLSMGEEPSKRLFPDSIERLDELYENDIDAFERLERSLSPGLLVSNHREIIIQPIGKSFAAELLRTSDQLSFLEQFGGANRSEKVYVCSSNKRNFFRPNQIILFYESIRSQGRGAIVAAANVASVLLQDKSKISQGQMKRTVLDSVEKLSATEQVTLVTFNSLLRFPRPVTLERLKQLGAHTGQNFVSATRIATIVGQQVMDEGWPDAK